MVPVFCRVYCFSSRIEVVACIVFVVCTHIPVHNVDSLLHMGIFIVEEARACCTSFTFMPKVWCNLCLVCFADELEWKGQFSFPIGTARHCLLASCDLSERLFQVSSKARSA